MGIEEVFLPERFRGGFVFVPTGVMVRTSSASGSSSFMDVSRNQATSVEVVSDEEEAEGTDDLVDTATMAFYRLSMRQAVKEVTAAMLEW
jgi:hypothetical protein